jgi:hypothetical protein
MAERQRPPDLPTAIALVTAPGCGAAVYPVLRRLSPPHAPSKDSNMTHPTLTEWHATAQARDPQRLNALLADEAVFWSPVVHSPQVGKVVTFQYLNAAFHVFFNETFRYVREVSDEEGAVLEFQVEIDGISVNGVDMIRWNAAGKVTEFKVMLRPLKAVNLIHQKMGAMLQAHAPRGPL